MKYILFFLLIIYINNSFSQISNFLKDNNLIERNKTIVLFIIDKECSNCYLLLNNAIEISKKYPENIDNYFVVTDNYSFAKNVLKNLNISAKTIFNKEVFNLPEINKLNTIYYRLNDQNYFFNKTNYNSYELDSIINGNKISINCFENMAIEDSTLGHDLFSHVLIPDKLIIFDKALQNFINIYCNSEEYEIKISKTKVEDSIFFYNFPDRVDKNLFEKIEPELTFSTLNEKNLDFLYINTISEYDNYIFCIFSLKRIYKRKNEENYGLFTTYFIAVKEVGNKKEEIYNLNSYSNYFYIDSFIYKNETYPVGPWIGYHPKFINKNAIQINVQKLDKDDKITFGGLATIELDFQNNITRMINIDTSASETIYIDHTINLANQQYILKKEMIDESRGLGIIKLEKK